MRFVKSIGLNSFNSLALKILLAYLAGTVFSITLLVCVSIVVLKGHVLGRMDMLGRVELKPQKNLLAQLDLADLAQHMAERVEFGRDGRPTAINRDEDTFHWVFDSLQRETAYRVLDEAGKAVLLSAAGAQFWPVDADQAGQSALVRGRLDFMHDGLPVYGATEPMVHGGQTWYLQVAVSQRMMELLHRVALPLVGTGITVFSLVLLVAFGLCAYFTLRYTLRPLRQVSESAAAISPHSLHARLRTQGVPSEIRPLVESFNRALERLERGYRMQQAFLGNAAHELKTPLALIRAQIELGEGGSHDRDCLLRDVEYMSRQVQQLLLLAEASEAHNYSFAALRVRAVVGETIAYLQRMAAAADVYLTVSAPADSVVWQADRGALFTLLKNLLENAIEHAPAGTAVNVEIWPDCICVRDFGPGVDKAQLPLLFERFWRADHRREHGAGLGLAICQEIALAHGWFLTAARAEPGLRFRLSIVQQGEPGFSGG